MSTATQTATAAALAVPCCQNRGDFKNRIGKTKRSYSLQAELLPHRKKNSSVVQWCGAISMSKSIHSLPLLQSLQFCLPLLLEPSQPFSQAATATTTTELHCIALSLSQHKTESFFLLQVQQEKQASKSLSEVKQNRQLIGPLKRCSTLYPGFVGTFTWRRRRWVKMLKWWNLQQNHQNHQPKSHL